MKRFFALFTLLAFLATASFAQDKHAGHNHAGHNHAHDAHGNHITDGDKATSTSEESTDGPKMTFDTKNIDYGTLPQNADGVRKFTFVNDGTEPLIIKQAKGSCGCTVPSYSKAPILPGEKSEISVKYDTKRIGPFNKSVRIITNMGPDPVVLTIKGVIQKEPEGLPEKEGNGLGAF